MLVDGLDELGRAGPRLSFEVLRAGEEVAHTLSLTSICSRTQPNCKKGALTS